MPVGVYEEPWEKGGAESPSREKHYHKWDLSCDFDEQCHRHRNFHDNDIGSHLITSDCYTGHNIRNRMLVIV